MATNYSKNGSTYWRETGSYGLNDQGKRLRREFLGSNRKKAEYKKKAFEHLMFYGLDYHEASEIYDDPTFQKKLDSGITLTDIEAFIRVKSESSNLEMPSLELSMKSWLFDVKRVSDDVKPSSFERYEGLYRHYIVGWPFSQKPYNLITSNDLQRHYNHQFENCGKSHNIIKETNKLIKAYYNYEIVQERVATNPAAGKKISIPGASDQKKRTEIMSSEDLKRFISALSGHRLEMFFILAMSTGMRIGELIALKLEDVDLEKGKISVSATQYACNVFDSEGNKKFKTMRNSTKNRLCREIPLPSNIIPTFEEYLLKRKKHRFKMGSAFIEQGYVFSDMLGGPLNYSNVRKEYVKIFTKENIPFKRIHSLRHLYASMLSANGAKISNIQDLLGHTSIETTQIYIHTNEESKREDVNTLKII